MRFISFFISFCIFTSSALAETTQSYPGRDGATYVYEKPRALDVITEVPGTAWLALKKSFTKDTLLPWAGILVSTSILIDHDEKILLEVQRQGRDLGIGNEEKTKTVLEAGDIKLLRLPSDTGSALYFLGDGWTHFGIAGGFLLYGYNKNDYRAWSTSYQLVHGMMISTIFNQALKRSFGRESPNERTEPRGKWRPFPSIKAYNENTARYDAMPSGHVMTSTLVMTIINENYPEYWYVTLPVGGTLISLLAWQMVNNGVHWASDYPLGFAMGLFYGKLVANNWRTKKIIPADTKEAKKTWKDFELSPLMTYHSALGLSATWEF